MACQCRTRYAGQIQRADQGSRSLSSSASVSVGGFVQACLGPYYCDTVGDIPTTQFQ